MEVVFEKYGYKLEPSKDGLCWRLYEWVDVPEEGEVRKGKPRTEGGWAFTGLCPTTLSYGIQCVLDRATMSVSAARSLRTPLWKLERFVTAFWRS